MKGRESGMPDEPLWETFFRADEALRSLQLTDQMRDVVEFGCGYGTFTIPAARSVQGTVFTFDIEPAMVETTLAKAASAGLRNVDARVRDFLESGTGLSEGSVDYAMLFNILHVETPEILLEEARRVLRDGGVLAIMHWRRDPPTPRGPSMDIRPSPEQCLRWCEACGFEAVGDPHIDLPPHHFGLAVRKASRKN